MPCLLNQTGAPQQAAKSTACCLQQRTWVGVDLIHMLAVPHEQAVAAEHALWSVSSGRQQQSNKYKQHSRQWTALPGLFRGLETWPSAVAAWLQDTQPCRPLAMCAAARTVSDSQPEQEVRLPSVFCRHWWHVWPFTCMEKRWMRGLQMITMHLLQTGIPNPGKPAENSRLTCPKRRHCSSTYLVIDAVAVGIVAIHKQLPAAKADSINSAHGKQQACHVTLWC